MKKYLLLLLLFSQTTFAQTPSPSTILESKLESRLSQLVKNSSGVTGLAVVDLQSGKQLLLNADIEFPQASAIKIPILMEVYKQAAEGRFSLSDPLPVGTENLVGGTGVLSRLEDAPVLSIRDLAILMIVLSDNAATNALLDLVGLQEINKTLKSLELEHTLVQRKMINAAASARGEENISTPREAAKILQLLYEGKFVDTATSEAILEILKKNDRGGSRIASGIPAQVPIAFKPGNIPGVSTEWTLVLLPERPYAIAVMESYKTPGASDGVMEQVSEVVYQYFWKLGKASKYGTYVR